MSEAPQPSANPQGLERYRPGDDVFATMRRVDTLDAPLTLGARVRDFEDLALLVVLDWAAIFLGGA